MDHDGHGEVDANESDGIQFLRLFVNMLYSFSCMQQTIFLPIKQNVGQRSQPYTCFSKISQDSLLDCFSNIGLVEMHI